MGHDRVARELQQGGSLGWRQHRRLLGARLELT
jgi:hypothetical protein